MAYLSINNLYKEKTILLFKECYALEKIHGTSAHISWKDGQLRFFSGGEKHKIFTNIFDHEVLKSKFEEHFPGIDVVVFGEAYGGKMQGMSDVYGKQSRFSVFDVKVGETWVNVPNAEQIATNLGLEFVWYVKTSTDIDNLTILRDAPAPTALKLGLGEKKGEGLVLRPLEEFKTSNGNRVIVKFKTEEFRETKTPRPVNEADQKVLDDAKAIAEEWVTYRRLEHVLDKLPDFDISQMPKAIAAMIEDVEREAGEEIVKSREARSVIGKRTAFLIKQKLNNDLK